MISKDIGSFELNHSIKNCWQKGSGHSDHFTCAFEGQMFYDMA
jgi:hypothetical protein